MTPFDWLEEVGRFAHFALRGLASAPLALRRPRLLLTQFHGIFLGVLPLAAVAGMAVGAVLWLQLHYIFERFEAKQYLPQALALAVVLEFAPITAGLIVAGRSGASIGAELGSMRLTEQIDALEVMGVPPMRQLIGPRVLALMIAMPLLTVFIAYMALGAGYLCEMLGGNLSLRMYVTESLRLLTLRDSLTAVLKTVPFGFLIGITGCYFGMTAHGGTEGVGNAATRSVVTSIFLVLVSNVVLVRLIQLL